MELVTKNNKCQGTELGFLEKESKTKTNDINIEPIKSKAEDISSKIFQVK